MNYIDALNKRYSVKKFDSEKKIPKETLDNILQAGRLSASSLGLQPYKILVIESEEMKQKITPAFYNPSQISTCSHLIVILTKKNIDENYVNGYFRHISKVRETPLEQLEPFRKSIAFYLEKHDHHDMKLWNEKQSYIVLGNLMFAAALEEVDTCPMEGFIPDKMEEILNIDTENESITVTLALGYRAEDDLFQYFKKVRKPEDKLFLFL